jgi:multiple sugar transport system substrate-binding protein
MKSKFSLLLFALLLTLILSAPLFASGREEQKTEEKVVFWSIMTGVAEGSIRRIVDDYNATNPAVKVEMVTVPGSWAEDTSLLTAVRGGTGPDVYYSNRQRTRQLAANGILEDITAYIDKVDKNLGSKYINTVWRQILWRGKIHAIPFDTDARALYYNKTVLRDAGIDLSIFDRKNGPIPLDKLFEIASKINQKDAQGHYTRVGFIPTYGEGHVVEWNAIFGGSYEDPAGGKFTPLHPKLVDAFNWLKNAFNVMGPKEVDLFLSTYEPPNNPPQLSPFITGRIGMMINGSAMISTLEEYAKDLDWDVTYPPVVNPGDNAATYAGGFCLAVPKGAKRAEAAIPFMLYMCGVEGQARYTREVTNLPTLLSVQANRSLYDERHRLFADLLPYAKISGLLPMHGTEVNALFSVQYAATVEQQDPVPLLKEAETKLQAELNQYLPIE